MALGSETYMMVSPFYLLTPLPRDNRFEPNQGFWLVASAVCLDGRDHAARGKR